MAAALEPRYDVIVCGAGSSGSVIAGRLATNPDVKVLLLEAGGTDDVPSVTEASQWPLNIGSERDWGFASEPDPRIHGRSIPFSMGKVLGGGSSINLMVWARGHRSDWDHFAAESGEQAWGYKPVLDLYRRIEDWHGIGERNHRGRGGPVFVQPAPGAHPLATATLQAARALGIPTYLRDAVTTYWHESGTAKMGRDAMSVVDGRLKVYGVQNLRAADASIMPRITSANTMAPCVIIGERREIHQGRAPVLSSAGFVTIARCMADGDRCHDATPSSTRSRRLCWAWPRRSRSSGHRPPTCA